MPIEVILSVDAFPAMGATKQKWDTMLGYVMPLDICFKTKWLLRTGRDWTLMLPVVFRRIVFAKSLY